MSSEGRINAIAIDHSEHSLNAFTWYLKNYHQPLDNLLLMHIQQMPKLPALGLLSGSMVVTDEYRAIIHDCIEKTKQLIDKYASLCKEGKVQYKVVLNDGYDSPGTMICDLVKEHAAEVIILGQRGISMFSRVLLGSTSDYVLHHATIPVIVIPPKQ